MSVEAHKATFRREDITYRLTVIDSAGAAVNITGWTLDAQWRTTGDSSSAIITKATGGSGISITNATAGLFEISLGSADTGTLTPGAYAYSVRRTNAGSIAILAHGRWAFIQEAAR